LKLYQSLYDSDIIVASPLAVRLKTGFAKEDEEDTRENIKFDCDFLSSIEILILD